MYMTGPCSASSALTSRKHSFVGATGANTNSPLLAPVAPSFTIVIRIGTQTYKVPCSWSKVQILPLITSFIIVFRLS